MTYASKPVLIEFAPNAPTSSSRPRADPSRPIYSPTPSPIASTSQIHDSNADRSSKPIILRYRSPRRSESVSLLETDGDIFSGITETPRTREHAESSSYLYPAERRHTFDMNHRSLEFSENVGVKCTPAPKPSRRRIFGWAVSSDRTPSCTPDKPCNDFPGPPSQPRRLRAPFLSIVAKKKPKKFDDSGMVHNTLDRSQQKTSKASTPTSKPFTFSSLPSIILAKREYNPPSSTIFFRRKKSKFQPEPIQPPERRPPPPPLPPYLRQDVAEIIDTDTMQRQRPSSLADSLSFDSTLDYDDADLDAHILAFGPEVLLDDEDDDEEVFSLFSESDSASITESEEVITPSSSHPYALVGLPSTIIVDESHHEDQWDDVVVLEHTLEQLVLANPISVNIRLASTRRQSCPSSTTPLTRPPPTRSHRRPSVPLRLPRSVSSTDSIKNSSTRNEIGSSTQSHPPQINLHPEGRLRPPVLIETLLDDSDGEFLDLRESIYSRTVSSYSRRTSFLSDNREDFLDLEWSSAGDASSLRTQG